MKLITKTASREATLKAMMGGVRKRQYIEGWHCLTKDFDFKSSSGDDFLALWRQCEDITNWVGDVYDEEEMASHCFDLMDLNEILEQGVYNDIDYCIYVPARLTDDEIKSFFKKEKEMSA